MERNITIPAKYLSDANLAAIAMRLTDEIAKAGNLAEHLAEIAALNMIREEQKERGGK